MYNYLEDFALKNVWCAPQMDRQAIMQLAKITPVGGVWNNFQLMWRQYTLPVASTRFHVYMIGQLSPALLGLFPSRYQWNTFTNNCNEMTMIVDLYVGSGVELPRFQAWYMQDADRNLIIAVQDPNPNIDVDLSTEPLYLRVYSNAFYQDQRGTPNNGLVVVGGMVPQSTEDIMTCQNTINTLKQGAGQVYCFVNGYKVGAINLFTAVAGDYLEWIYDGSIYKVVDFVISDLLTFDSTLDTETKYLLHYAGLGDGTIDYQDDIDLFLVNPTGVSNNQWQGVYMHRNLGPAALRNITHKDYSTPVSLVMAFAADQPQWTAPNSLHIRMHIRYGGWNRPLVNENNRIKELYKLPDAEILNAMIGTQATVTNWQAAVLEASPYITLMNSPIPCVAETTVEAAFGYNAISGLLGYTPAFTFSESGQPSVNVPYGLQQVATAYEYDVNGLLLGWYLTLPGSVYPASNSAANLIELVAGGPSTLLDEVYGSNNVTLSTQYDYRMYTCPIVNGVPNNVWTDVTGTSAYVISSANVLTWNIDETQVYTLIRSNQTNLAYTLELDTTEGILVFSLTQQMLRNGQITNWVMQIPMGELVLHLNGHPIIEGLDYIVNFPQISINNKAYLNAEGPQKIDIRFSGFCNSDLTRENVEADYGFVQYGMLSYNDRFNIRDDKVIRIVAGGRYWDRSQLSFPEPETPPSVPASLANGQPYLIQDIVVPTRGLTVEGTYELRAGSVAIDEAIENYLTLYLPQPAETPPDVIPALYRVFSPFLCKIIYDLQSGVLDDPRMYQQISTATVMAICQPYEYLLAFDPSQQAHAPDSNFVIVDPTNLMTVIELSIYHAKFLYMAAAQYCPSVQLNQFISIQQVATTT